MDIKQFFLFAMASHHFYFWCYHVISDHDVLYNRAGSWVFQGLHELEVNECQAVVNNYERGLIS